MTGNFPRPTPGRNGETSGKGPLNNCAEHSSRLDLVTYHTDRPDNRLLQPGNPQAQNPCASPNHPTQPQPTHPPTEPPTAADAPTNQTHPTAADAPNNRGTQTHPRTVSTIKLRGAPRNHPDARSPPGDEQTEQTDQITED
ncbi:hypothetical protein GCM10027360_05520 [Amycolatopsis echigonensis]